MAKLGSTETRCKIKLSKSIGADSFQSTSQFLEKTLRNGKDPEKPLYTCQCYDSGGDDPPG